MGQLFNFRVKHLCQSCASHLEGMIQEFAYRLMSWIQFFKEGIEMQKSQNKCGFREEGYSR